MLTMCGNLFTQLKKTVIMIVKNDQYLCVCKAVSMHHSGNSTVGCIAISSQI